MNSITSASLAAGYAALMRVNAVQLAREPLRVVGAMTGTAPVAAAMPLTPDPALAPRPGPGRGALVDIAV